MAVVYRSVTGPVNDPQGNLAQGFLVAKLLRPLIDDTTFVSPEELRVDIVDGAFTLVLAAPAMYDFQVKDVHNETWWNFQAPLDNSSAADISLAELYALSGNYIEQDFDSPITSFLGLLDTPTTYTGDGTKHVTVKADESGLEFIDHSMNDLPDPSGEPDGQVLTTETGAAIWDDPPTDVPDPSIEPEGDVLTVSGGTAAWLAPAIDGTGRYQAAYGNLEENEQSNSITLGTTSTWYPWVTGTASGNEYRTSVVSNALVIGAEGGGVHEITVQCSFSGIFNATVHGTVWHNGADSNMHFERKLSAGGDVGSASITGLLSLIAGDTLTLAFESDITGTLDIHHFSLVTRRVGEESQATYPDPTGESDGDVLTIDTGAAVWATPVVGGGKEMVGYQSPEYSGAAADPLTFEFWNDGNKTEAELATDGWAKVEAGSNGHLSTIKNVENWGLRMGGAPSSNYESTMQYAMTALGTSEDFDFIACAAIPVFEGAFGTSISRIAFGIGVSGANWGANCTYRLGGMEWKDGASGWLYIGNANGSLDSVNGSEKKTFATFDQIFFRLLRVSGTLYVCHPKAGPHPLPGSLSNWNYNSISSSHAFDRINLRVEEAECVWKWIWRIN